MAIVTIMAASQYRMRIEEDPFQWRVLPELRVFPLRDIGRLILASHSRLRKAAGSLAQRPARSLRRRRWGSRGPRCSKGGRA